MLMNCSAGQQLAATTGERATWTEHPLVERSAAMRRTGGLAGARPFRQPLPSVRAAADLALDDAESDASVFPAFESAAFDGFAI